MDIDAAKPRHVQHLLGQNPAIGHHGADIGLQVPQLPNRFFLPEVLRLEYGDSGSQSRLLHGRSRQLHAPALGPVRLGIDAHHLEAVRQNLFQAGGRDVRGPHKYHAHGQASSFSSSSVRNRSMISV